MINFKKLGKFSIFSIDIDEQKYYYVYSHIADSAVYGWYFETQKQAIAFIEKENFDTLNQILYIDDSKIVFFRGDDVFEYQQCKNIKCKLISASDNKPEIYTSFEYEFLKRILKLRINIYHDYQDQGFSCLQEDYPDEKFKVTDFINNDGIAGYFEGESLYINKKDYNRIKLK